MSCAQRSGNSTFHGFHAEFLTADVRCSGSCSEQRHANDVRDEQEAWMTTRLDGTVALVAGATRGAGRGIAVELGAAGATVYVTGRTTRQRRSEYDRPETIEETAELVTAAGGTGIAVPTDHLVAAEVQALVERIDAEQGQLNVLVNDIWGGEN